MRLFQSSLVLIFKKLSVFGIFSTMSKIRYFDNLEKTFNILEIF